MKKISVLILWVFILVLGCKDNDSINSSNPNNVVPADFLSNSNYDKLIVEIQYVNGFQPSAATVNNLTAFLQARLNKSSGITVVQSEIASPGKSVYLDADIQSNENLHRTQKTSGKTLTAYFFFADGEYSGSTGNSKILGIAYGSSSMAIFEKSIKDLSGGVSQPSVATLESTVVLHEFGHILGLVNRGTPLKSAHQDANGKHCTDTNCLMYFSVDTSDAVANLLGGNIPELTTGCLDDLRSNGGK
ncbi:MAG: peptidase [Cyclobacteriaceae bacterium]|nr:peptidase [Cyclobacteriaceae bacterium]